jgi:hypothetical protein
MFPKHPRLAHALPLLLACSGTASAQLAGTGSTTPTAGGIIVNPIRVGDADVNTMFGVYVGIDACASAPPAEVVFDLDGVPADKVTLDVYTGTNCNSIDRDKTDEGTSTCTFITTQAIEDRTRDLEVKVPANLLFKGGCDNGQASMSTLWFLAVDETQAGAEASKYGTIAINVDGDPPNAPTMVTGGSGESLIRVGWRAGESDLLEFVVYIDNAPTTGGSPAPVVDGGIDGGSGSSTSPDGRCGSNALTSGGLPSELPSTIRTRTIPEETATGIDLTPEDIGGDRAAIAVSTVDKAGNRSPLSNLACVAVVPTESFWDRYKANGGEAEGGCACRTSGKAQWMNAGPIALALLALLRRSRKRAS